MFFFSKTRKHGSVVLIGDRLLSGKVVHVDEVASWGVGQHFFISSLRSRCIFSMLRIPRVDVLDRTEQVWRARTSSIVTAFGSLHQLNER